MEIRKAAEEDLPAVMELYDTARRFMRRTGNLSQWVNGYPWRELIVSDMRRGESYVCEENGQLAAVFMFRIGEEPSYSAIREGAWLNEKPYGVVHRLGSSGVVPGAGRFCLDWSYDRCGNLRVDTHRDNAVMRRILEEKGFVRCGVLTIEDGTERIGYQKI
ncbi:MAG: GNAT family N-acetyltransferase [Oscillibacter sp.]|jgi:hypothetical protein|nr:GNAT family N-acetyltransferase [Oscillibacter sp.]